MRAVRARAGAAPLTALSRWKIFDNFRRSLVPPSLLGVLAGGWLFGPGPAWVWTSLVAGVVFLPALLGLVIELLRKPDEREWMAHLSLTSKSSRRPIALALLALIFLPYDTLINLDAILRSGVRMLFTRRGLLLWHMPSYAVRNARRTLADFYKEMWVAPVLAGALAFTLRSTRPEEWLFFASILFLWLVSPVIAWWISKPLVSPAPALTVEQRAFLRTSARRTWRFFATFVGPEDNWLPPDNFQEYPAPAIASRTSPTNIGMSLLANLSAYDFGYLSAGEFLRVTGQTLATMQTLERYRGHFYNWYDTRTLKPLRPLYVSSVDSGNLVGSQLTLQGGLAELKDQPVLSACPFQGLQDTLQVLAEHVPSLPAPDLGKKIQFLQDKLHSLTLNGQPQTLAAAGLMLDEIHRTGEELVRGLPADHEIESELDDWARAFERQAGALRDDLRFLVPEARHFGPIPTLAKLAGEKSIGSETLSSVGGAVAEGCRYRARWSG